jgi:hypothetical protein
MAADPMMEGKFGGVVIGASLSDADSAGGAGGDDLAAGF